MKTATMTQTPSAAAERTGARAKSREVKSGELESGTQEPLSAGSVAGSRAGRPPQLRRREPQRTIGNQAMLRMLQREAAANRPESQAAESADNSSDQPNPSLSGGSVGLEGGPLSQAISDRIDQSRGAGVPLEPKLKMDMEAGLGVDFSNVRVHSGTESQRLNRQLSARAFAIGNDIFLGRGTSPGDRRTMAHELTHVVQQRSLNRSASPTVGPAGDAHERQADAIGIEAALRPSSSKPRTDGKGFSSPTPARLGLTQALTSGRGGYTVQRDAGSADYNEGYQDGLKGDDSHPGPRNEDALTDYDEGYAKGHYEFAQRSQGGAPAPVQEQSQVSSPPVEPSIPANASSSSPSTTDVLAGAGMVGPPLINPLEPPMPFGAPDTPIQFPRLPGETPFNPSFGAGEGATAGAPEVAATAPEVAATTASEVAATTAPEVVAGAAPEVVAAATAPEVLAAATVPEVVAGGTAVVEGGSLLAGAATVLAAVPVWGWIALGVIAVGVGIYLGSKYLLSDDQKPVRPLSPEEEQRAVEGQVKPALLPGPEGQNIQPAVDPATGEPLSTPAAPGPAAGIDPVTGERLYTPAQQDSEPLEAADKNKNRRKDYSQIDPDDDDLGGPVPDERISTSEKAELEDSAELKAVLPDAEARRAYMKWLQEGHIGPHDHIAPGSPEMHDSVGEFLLERPEWRH
jgi:hypothetical protein